MPMPVNVSTSMALLMKRVCIEMFKTAGLPEHLTPSAFDLMVITEKVYHDATPHEAEVMELLLSLQEQIDQERVLEFQERATKLFTEYCEEKWNEA